MNTIAILDTETTGTDDAATCIEIAVVLYSVPHAAPVRSFSSLIRADANPAESVNRIPAALLAEAPEAGNVWPGVARFMASADAIVAHGAEFDRRFVPAGVDGGKPWICSMDDLAWPRATKPRMSLVALALAYDLGVSHAHRAAVDCDLLSRLFTRAHDIGPTSETLISMLARGLRPKARFVVAEKGYDPARNELAKAAGFSWDAAAKEWGRIMAIEDAGKLAFATSQCP